VIKMSPFQHRLLLSVGLLAAGFALAALVPSTWVRAAGAFMMVAGSARYPPFPRRLTPRGKGALLQALKRKPRRKAAVASLLANALVAGGLFLEHLDIDHVNGWAVYFAVSSATTLLAVVVLRWPEESAPDAAA
jgi:hypothetical protein